MGVAYDNNTDVSKWPLINGKRLVDVCQDIGQINWRVARLIGMIFTFRVNQARITARILSSIKWQGRSTAHDAPELVALILPVTKLLFTCTSHHLAT